MGYGGALNFPTKTNLKNKTDEFLMQFIILKIVGPAQTWGWVVTSEGGQMKAVGPFPQGEVAC